MYYNWQKWCPSTTKEIFLFYTNYSQLQKIVLHHVKTRNKCADFLILQTNSQSFPKTSAIQGEPKLSFTSSTTVS